MLNTQQTQTETNTIYNTTFTAEQFAKLEALTREWNATCKGDYESTFVGGVAHAYCDSGIISDAWAVEDVEILDKYLRNTVKDSEDETSVFYETDIVNECGNDIIRMHTEGKRTHMWHTLFIADMETALDCDDTETWASYAWDLESYMYEQHLKKQRTA